MGEPWLCFSFDISRAGIYTISCDGLHKFWVNLEFILQREWGNVLLPQSPVSTEVKVTVALPCAPTLTNPSNTIPKRRCSCLSWIFRVLGALTFPFKTNFRKVKFTYNESLHFKSAVGDKFNHYCIYPLQKAPFALLLAVCFYFRSLLPTPYLPGNHWSDFYHYRLVLLVQRFRINWIAHYSFFFCLASVAQHVFEIPLFSDQEEAKLIFSHHCKHVQE